MSAAATVILPGATIGILGGGQLGRMSALAAFALGYRMAIYDPAAGGPAQQVTPLGVVAPWDDLAALDRFASLVDVVTVEFENIPVAALEHLAQRVPVRPGPQVLHLCQNRLREKTFLRQHGFPCPAWAVARNAAELAEAVAAVGRPCVLKTADFGYDGKGQVKIGPTTDLAAAWAALGAPVGTIEAFVDFVGEFSVLVARTPSGASACFPVAENVHTRHILDQTTIPARLDPAAEAEAIALARAIAEALDLRGLLAVELFRTRSGQWLVNELAPRPHNSGHWSLDGGATSQFEQHVRAVAGLPLGATHPLAPSAMLNLLGDLWPALGQPDWSSLLADFPEAHLHLYGKAQARPGRKMGHLNLTAPTPALLRQRTAALRARLGLTPLPEDHR